MKRNENMALLCDSYQEVSIDWLAVTLKIMIITGGGQEAMCSQGSWDECAMEACAARINDITGQQDRWKSRKHE